MDIQKENQGSVKTLKTNNTNIVILINKLNYSVFFMTSNYFIFTRKFAKNKLSMNHKQSTIHFPIKFIISPQIGNT